MWNLGGSYNSSVKPEIQVRILGIYFQGKFRDSIVNSRILVWISGMKMGIQCRCWNSCADPWFPMWLLGCQCGFWSTSEDLELPVWILGLQCGSLDYSLDPGFPVRNLYCGKSFKTISRISLKSWDFYECSGNFKKIWCELWADPGRVMWETIRFPERIHVETLSKSCENLIIIMLHLYDLYEHPGEIPMGSQICLRILWEYCKNPVSFISPSNVQTVSTIFQYFACMWPTTLA